MAVANWNTAAQEKSSGYCSTDIVSVLLEHDADVNVSNNRVQTPLHILTKCLITRQLMEDRVGSNKIRDLMKLLLVHLADPNATNKDGRTCLHRAARYGHRDSAKLLLHYRANVAARDNKGKTPLDLAREHRKGTMISLFKTAARTGPSKVQVERSSESGS